MYTVLLATTKPDHGYTHKRCVRVTAQSLFMP
jgi:hypothetical protein